MIEHHMGHFLQICIYRTSKKEKTAIPAFIPILNIQFYPIIVIINKGREKRYTQIWDSGHFWLDNHLKFLPAQATSTCELPCEIPTTIKIRPLNQQGGLSLI